MQLARMFFGMSFLLQKSASLSQGLGDLRPFRMFFLIAMEMCPGWKTVSKSAALASSLLMCGHKFVAARNNPFCMYSSVEKP